MSDEVMRTMTFANCKREPFYITVEPWARTYLMERAMNSESSMKSAIAKLMAIWRHPWISTKTISPSMSFLEG